jgi:hypothetical protein
MSGYNKGTCICIFITALFTIAKLWKQPRDAPLLTNRLKNKWYLYIMEFYSAMKNEILSFAGK